MQSRYATLIAAHYSKEANNMSELQPEGDDDLNINKEVDESTAAGDGAVLATATEEKQDKSDDGAQAAINKQHRKYRNEERKRIDAEKETKTLKDKLAAIEAEQDDVVIPPVPDPFDEDYEAKIQTRDAAIRKRADLDAQATVKKDQGESRKEAANLAEQKRIATAVNQYEARAVQFGLNVEEVKKAGDTVIDYGITGDLAMYLLEDKDGPLITNYLASNPLELDDLRNMSTIDAAIKMNSTIREKAVLLKPKPTNTPDPADILDGGGVPETVDPLLKGATFE